MAKVQKSDIEVSEFELQTCYYFHFRTNTFAKGMNPQIPQKLICQQKKNKNKKKKQKQKQTNNTNKRLL